MKSQLIIIALICLISFNSLLASQETKRRHHNKARKWAEKDNCVCSSVLTCDAAKFSVNLGREDGKGDNNNCQCNKKNACECQANQTAGVLASDKQTACKCLAECQKSAGAKALDGVKAVGEGVLAVGSAGVEAVKSGLSSAGAAIGSAVDSTGKALNKAADATGKALSNAADATGKALSNAANATGKAVGKAVDATKDLANSAGKAVVNGLNSAANATSQAVNQVVDAAKDAVDVCQCSKADFSKIEKGAVHNVSSTTLVKGLPCNCTEECVCKDLTIIKRRFAKLQKQHKITKAKKLLASIQTTYNGNFKNGDTCTCDENMVNNAKALLANGVQGVKEAGKAVANKITNAADATGKAINNAVDATGKALSNAADATGKAVGKAVDATKDLANAAGKAVANGLNKAGDAISNGATAAVEKGKELAKQTGQALSNAGSAVSNAASSAVGAVGELLAGECIQTDAKEYKENPKNPSGPWLAQGRQKRSNGLCEVEEKCVCDLGKQVELKVQSKLQYSQKQCTCEINSATQLINKGKKWISGSRLRFSKKTLIQVRAFCQSLNQPQCLSQDGCSFNQQKQQCNVAKQITKQLRFQRTSKKIQMSRNLNRFKQVVFRA